MRFVKYLAIAIAVVIIAGGIGGYVFLKNLDLAEYSKKIETMAEEATGRDLVIGGELALKISLSPGIVVKDVSFANAPWGTRKQMATIERFEAQLSIPALLTGTISIKRLIIDKPDIWLETNAQGKGNWEMQPKKAKNAKEAAEKPADKPIAKADDATTPAMKVAVGLLEISNGFVNYTDGTTGVKNTVKINTLSLNPNDASGDKPQKLVVDIDVDGKQIDLTGHTAGLKALTGNDDFPFDLKAQAYGATVLLDGKIDQPLSGKGLDVSAEISTHDMPGAPAVHVTLKLTDPEENYLAENIKIKLPKGEILGSVRFIPAAVPELRFSLAGKDVDLTALSVKHDKKAANDNSPQNKKDDKAADGRVIPAVDTPASLLSMVRPNGKIAFDNTTVAEGLIVPFAGIDIKGEKGHIEIIPKVELTKGVVSGSIVLTDAGGDNIATSIDLRGDNIVLGELYKGQEELRIESGGLLDMVIDLAGKGKTLRTIMGSLNGKASIVVDKTQLHSSALGWLTGDVTSNMLSAFKSNDSAKMLDMVCAVVHFGVKDGVMKTDKEIVVDADKFKVIGSGTVNLGNEELSLVIKPSAKKGLRIGATQALTGMTRIKGTLGSPSVGMDAGGTAKTAATVGAALATGGLSYLGQKLVGAVVEDKDPCVTAAKNTPFAGRFKASGKTQDTQPEAKPAANNNEPESAEQFMNDLGKGLGGLFGK